MASHRILCAVVNTLTETESQITYLLAAVIVRP